MTPFLDTGKPSLTQRSLSSLIHIYYHSQNRHKDAKGIVSLFLLHSVSFSLRNIWHRTRLAVLPSVRLLPCLRLLDQLQLRLRRLHMLRHLSVAGNAGYLRKGGVKEFLICTINLVSLESR